MHASIRRTAGLSLALLALAAPTQALAKPAKPKPVKPAVPELIQPADGAKFEALPAFAWNPAARAVTYEFQIAADSGFNAPVLGRGQGHLRDREHACDDLQGRLQRQLLVARALDRPQRRALGLVEGPQGRARLGGDAEPALAAARRRDLVSERGAEDGVVAGRPRGQATSCASPRIRRWGRWSTSARARSRSRRRRPPSRRPRRSRPARTTGRSRRSTPRATAARRRPSPSFKWDWPSTTTPAGDRPRARAVEVDYYRFSWTPIAGRRALRGRGQLVGLVRAGLEGLLRRADDGHVADARRTRCRTTSSTGACARRTRTATSASGTAGRTSTRRSTPSCRRSRTCT